MSCTPTQEVLGYGPAQVPCVRGIRRGGAVRLAGGEQQSGPVVVPADVLEGLEAVRGSGAHMVERTHVLVLAKRMGYRRTVRWVEENPKEYARGISHGFEAAPGEEEG